MGISALGPISLTGNSESCSNKSKSVNNKQLIATTWENLAGGNSGSEWKVRVSVGPSMFVLKVHSDKLQVFPLEESGMPGAFATDYRNKAWPLEGNSGYKHLPLYKTVLPTVI